MDRLQRDVAIRCHDGIVDETFGRTVDVVAGHDRVEALGGATLDAEGGHRSLDDARRDHVGLVELLPKAEVGVVLTSKIKRGGLTHVPVDRAWRPAATVAGGNPDRVAEDDGLHPRVGGELVVVQQRAGQVVQNADAKVVRRLRRRHQFGDRIDRRLVAGRDADVAAYENRIAGGRELVVDVGSSVAADHVAGQHAVGTDAAGAEERGGG